MPVNSSFRIISSINHNAPNLLAKRNHFSLTKSLELGDGLQTNERIFWDCKLYDDERATMMDILSEDSKKKQKKKQS
jgi:hypothetical protein